ncbi:MAG: DUF4296 domain-containing protein [Bacteroidales bacterium]|jgi:hypothetical protein|nr:DUF4296 domain-containing protein [Bacteroidales bacterium]
MKSAHLGIIVFFVLVLASCNSHKPDKLLSKHKMTELLADIETFEVQMQNIERSVKYNRDSVRLYVNAGYKEIFDKYGINDSIFRQNVEYYFSEPEKLLDIQKNLDKRFN